MDEVSDTEGHFVGDVIDSVFVLSIQHVVDNFVMIFNVPSYRVECTLIVEGGVKVVGPGVDLVGDGDAGSVVPVKNEEPIWGQHSLAFLEELGNVEPVNCLSNDSNIQFTVLKVEVLCVSNRVRDVIERVDLTSCFQLSLATIDADDFLEIRSKNVGGLPPAAADVDHEVEFVVASPLLGDGFQILHGFESNIFGRAWSERRVGFHMTFVLKVL